MEEGLVEERLVEEGWVEEGWVGGGCCPHLHLLRASPKATPGDPMAPGPWVAPRSDSAREPGVTPESLGCLTKGGSRSAPGTPIQTVQLPVLITLLGGVGAYLNTYIFIFILNRIYCKSQSSFWQKPLSFQPKAPAQELPGPLGHTPALLLWPPGLGPPPRYKPPPTFQPPRVPFSPLQSKGVLMIPPCPGYRWGAQGLLEPP